MTVSPTQATSVDRHCSTNVPLSAGEVYTGRAVEMTKWASATVFIFTDRASAAEGLSLEQSSDGVNWDKAREFSVEGGIQLTVGIDMSSQFFRVVYTNGNVDQGEMRLQTVFHPTRQMSLLSNQPLEFVPVRITNGQEFDDGEQGHDLQHRLLETLEMMVIEQRITNYHLSQLTDEDVCGDEFDIQEN